MLTMEYSEARGTWNVIDLSTHEWVFEGTFDQCCDMVNNCNCIDDQAVIQCHESKHWNRSTDSLIQVK